MAKATIEMDEAEGKSTKPNYQSVKQIFSFPSPLSTIKNTAKELAINN